MIPDLLIEALEKELERIPFARLKKARESLTEKYRKGLNPRISSLEERIAYLATRMPATFAALENVLAQIPCEGKTLLDLGAGPGTAFWAAPQSLLTHIEQDPELIALAKTLAPHSQATWIQGDFKTIPFPPTDIALFSYSFNEAPDFALLERAWKACHTLVLLEPGTPKGYSHILEARSLLLSQGAYLIAPCPHALSCPLVAPDWCHFAVRLPRLKWHKDLKGGTLGYEDEKYSYLIASKTPTPPYQGRILAPPKHHSGHLSLRLCTAQGITTPTLSKRDGAPYKQAKKLNWDDKVF